MRIETLFALMANTRLRAQVFPDPGSISFEDIVAKAKTWQKDKEMVFGCGNKDVWIHEDGAIHITKVGSEIVLNGAWPIQESETLEKEYDLLMTSLVMCLWTEKTGGILPFSKFDLNGLKKNIHKVENQLKEWGIDPKQIVRNGEQFKIWKKY